MRYLEVVIQPSELERITDVLRKNDVDGLTVSEVRIFERDKPRVHEYRGCTYPVEFTPRLKVEIVLADFKVPQVREAIRAVIRAAGGDGMIWVSSVDELIRIRTGEQEHAA
jgi:nitrogen regulatory protein P-II 1